MKKTFTDYVMENTIAEKDLEGGRFEVESSFGDGTFFRYFKGNEMNILELFVAGEGPGPDTVNVSLKVSGKEVIMNGLPRERFILKMREFLAKIK